MPAPHSGRENETKQAEILSKLQFERDGRAERAERAAQKCCHHTSNNPTAPQRRSRCDVGQTSKAKASNSFSVTLGDPAALCFLHMYTENPMFLKTHECIPMRKHFLMHWSGATVHFLNYLLLSCSLSSRNEFASTVSLPSPPYTMLQSGICHSCLDL